jgi:putative transposase
MQVQKAYKFQLKVRSRQQNKLRRAAGCCRFVWNKMLELQKTRLDWNEPVLEGYTLDEVLAHQKQTYYPFLYDAPAQSLQQVNDQLVTAIFNAFDPKMPQAFPIFKKKGRKDSFRIPQGFEWNIKDERVTIPNIGSFRYRNSYQAGELIGTPKNMTVSREGDNWFVSIGVEYEVPEVVHPHMDRVGIDLGLKNFAVLSTGEVIAPLNAFRKLERELAAAQRKLSRKQKFGSNWKKQKAVVSGIHRRIANCRRDFLHKHSDRITNNHGDLRMEGLKVSSMAASAAGTVEEPGVNVSAKSGMNKSILDQGMYEFRRQIRYKVLWKGGKFGLVDPKYTSQECPECHHIDTKNRPTRDWFCCLKCGFHGPADWVASLNISQRDTLPEPAKRLTRKRKPTKARSRACGSRNPSVMAVANPTAGAGSNRVASLGTAEASAR